MGHDNQLIQNQFRPEWSCFVLNLFPRFFFRFTIIRFFLVRKSFFQFPLICTGTTLSPSFAPSLVESEHASACTHRPAACYSYVRQERRGGGRFGGMNEGIRICRFLSTQKPYHTIPFVCMGVCVCVGGIPVYLELEGSPRFPPINDGCVGCVGFLVSLEQSFSPVSADH